MRINPAHLTDPTSALVRDALTRKCIICKAVRTVDCHNTIRPNEPLPGRLVHIARALGLKETDQEED